MLAANSGLTARGYTLSKREDFRAHPLPIKCPGLALGLRHGHRATMESIRNKTILVVEDDASLLRALEKVLSNEGCVVTCASWAAEAMDHLADSRKRFDLIITDLRVPFVRGNTILRMIARWSYPASRVPQPDVEGTTAMAAARKTSPVVPIIVITAFATPDMKAECLAQGAAAFLEKPVNTQELLSAISAVLAPPDSGSTYPAAA